MSGITIAGPHIAGGCSAAVFYGIFVVGGANLNLHDAAMTHFAQWWTRTVEMSRAGQVIGALTPAQQDEVREALRERLAQHEADGVLRMPARTWVASASA